MHTYSFDLKLFPYDIQAIPFHIGQRQDDAYFDLTIAQVQFCWTCLEIPEWKTLQPTVAKIANGKSGNVVLHFERNYGYYNQNVVYIIFLLVLLSFSIFAFDHDSWSDRVKCSPYTFLRLMRWSFVAMVGGGIIFNYISSRV